MPSRGTQAPRDRPQRRLDRRRRGSPSMPRWRASTRLTLPSRIAPRSPDANAAIAAAVERPMPGKRLERRRVARKRAPEALGDLARRRVQVARAAVVAEAAPAARARRPRRRARAPATSGNVARKRVVVRDHRRDLRLLQHDLGRPRSGTASRVRCHGRSWRPCVRLPGDDTRAAKAGIEGSGVRDQASGLAAAGSDIDGRRTARRDRCYLIPDRESVIRADATARRAAAAPSPPLRTSGTWRSVPRACGARPALSSSSPCAELMLSIASGTFALSGYWTQERALRGDRRAEVAARELRVADPVLRGRRERALRMRAHERAEAAIAPG